MRLGNGNESDSSAPTIRLATLIRGARTAAGGDIAMQAHFYWLCMLTHEIDAIQNSTPTCKQ